MGSGPRGEGLGWAAAALGGFALGAALVWALRAIQRGRGGPARESRISVSLLFVALSIVAACGAALLIAPPKALLSNPALWRWCGGWTAVGLLCVLFPRWGGAPLLIAALALAGLLSAEVSAWHPAVPRQEIARFVPYEIGERGARGNLSVPDRNAVPVLDKLTLNSRDCALEARVMDLSGPLAALFGERRYLLARIVDGSGRELHRFPEGGGPLRGVRKPGAPRGPWTAVRTLKSPVRPLEELEPLVWSFDEEGELTETNPKRSP